MRRDVDEVTQYLKLACADWMALSKTLEIIEHRRDINRIEAENSRDLDHARQCECTADILDEVAEVLAELVDIAYNSMAIGAAD